MDGIPLWQAVLLGTIEGLTEYLPISSTGHLTITEKLLGMRVDDPAVTAFTAIVQIGSILAAVIYFWKDIIKIIASFLRGLFSVHARTTADWRVACAVIVGSMPIAAVGFLLRNVIEGPLRSLWVVAAGLILWSGVMVFAERAATHQRSERDLRAMDGLVIGSVQVLALIPGVSRSGATISAGLLRDLDRVTATRVAFLLGIPALVAAGGYQAIKAQDEISVNVGWLPTIVGTVVSFVVAYAAIAWLLRFVSKNSIMPFVWYRIGLGLFLIVLLSFNVISPV